jgi:hypothetical protein
LLATTATLVADADGLGRLVVQIQSGRAGYTEEQLKLAGQLGAVIALAQRCGGNRPPTDPLRRALRSAGLSDDDFMRPDTAFRLRVEEQARTLAMTGAMREQAGVGRDTLRRDACRKLTEMYGPKGWVRPGLAP